MCREAWRSSWRCGQTYRDIVWGWNLLLVGGLEHWECHHYGDYMVIIHMDYNLYIIYNYNYMITGWWFGTWFL